MRFRAPEPPGSFLAAGLHLGGLSAVALAQPLFDLLGENVEFFAVRGSTRWDVLAFGLGLTLVPPLLLLALVAAAGTVARRAATALQLLSVGALVALIGLQALRRIEAPLPALLAVAACAGAAASLAYARVKAVRFGASVVGAAPPVFLALFLLVSPASRLVLGSSPEPRLGRVDADTPVVVVVLDELPTISLVDERFRIDGVRYPSFARLAADATWFRNATTVHEWTTEAAPAILTGLYPKERELPLYLDHPDNLFTLLGGSHRLRVFESQTRLCPDELCREGRTGFAGRMRSILADTSVVYPHLLLPEGRLAPLGDAWMGFRREDGRPEAYTGRERQAASFAAALERGTRPTLYFLHVLLPHHPWEYLPDGKRYPNQLQAQPGMVDERWVGDPELAVQAWQRHLLQVGFTDRVLGSILDRLQDEGLYDDALVVVTADHGVSFRPHGERRRVHAGNLEEIAFVPLFVKEPRQKRGRIVDAHVRTIDIVPTVADVLGARLPWRADGRSAFRTGAGEHPDVVVLSSSGTRVSGDFSELIGRRADVLARQLRLFGSGGDSLFAIGPRPELLGREVDGLAASAPDGERVRLYGSAAYDPDSAVVPARAAGRLFGVASGRDVAVAVNGRVAAVTRSFEQDGRTLFSAVLPEDALRPGANDVRVFLVTGAGRLEELHPDEP